MIAAGKTCQPAKFFHMPGYRRLRSDACGVSASSRGSRPANKCDKVLCEAMASASKGLRGGRIKRLRAVFWWMQNVLLGRRNKPCGAYAKRMSGTSHATCMRQIIEGSRSYTIKIGGKRYGSWKDFLFKEPRVKCSSRRRINSYGVTPRCVKPLLPLAKIKKLLQRKYGRMTYKQVTKTLAYELYVIIHKYVDRRSGDSGKRIIKVDGHTGRVIKVSRPERYMSFDD